MLWGVRHADEAHDDELHEALGLLDEMEDVNQVARGVVVAVSELVALLLTSLPSSVSRESSFPPLCRIGLPPAAARAEISPLTVTAEARTIIGSYLGSSVPARDIPRYVRLWREGKLPVEKLISSTIRLDQINEAMDLLADGGAVRQVILFDGDDPAR